MSAPVRAVIASATIGLLAGCGTLEPDYDRPAAPTPAAFPTGPAYPAPPGPDQPGPDPVQAAKIAWKAFFTDEKLRAVIQAALANNRDMRVAVANIEAAQAQYRVQRSDLFPTVNASTGASYGRDYAGATPGLSSGGGAAASPYETAHEFTTSVGFTAYEIDLFGRIRSLAHGALEQYLATEEARRAEQISLIAEVATDYMTLSSDIASLSQYKDNLVSSRESLEVTRRRFNFGAADELDVAQADTVVQQARASVAGATTTVATDLNALNLVVGAPLQDALLPDGATDRIMVMETLPVGLDSRVLLSRPDVLEAEHTLKSANAEIGAARAAFFPAISLTASGGTTSAAFAQLFKGASAVWSFAPSISVPIFDGGANQANLDYDKAERTVDIAKYEQAIQEAFEEVANALARRGTIDEEVSADQALVAAAATSLTLSTARYTRGADTYLNVLSAQRTLYSAQQTLITGRLTRSTNLVTLYKTLGGGLDQ
jgi:multidrug efflux system outer membrane protein